MRVPCRAALLALLPLMAAAVPVRHGRGASLHGDASAGAAARARSAVAAGLLDGDVNIVHLTDVHSWLSGHAHEPADEADYPDVLAFFQHIEAMAHAKVCAGAPLSLLLRAISEFVLSDPAERTQGKDVFLFNSGDIVDGTGLAGATPVDGAAILPIVQQVRFWQRGAIPPPLPRASLFVNHCGGSSRLIWHRCLSRQSHAAITSYTSTQRSRTSSRSCLKRALMASWQRCSGACKHS